MHGDVITALRSAGDHPLMRAFPQGAVFSFDQDLRYLAAGGLGLADVGLSREALEGNTIFEVFPPETSSVIEPFYRAALRGESTTLDVPYEGHIYTQRLAPVYEADGRVVAGIGFTQDVTEARAVEEALRESEQRNRLSFVHAPVGKAIVELDGRWRQVNDAVVELTGYSEEELLTMTFQDITHPEDLEIDLSHLARLVAGEITSYRIEKRYVTAVGRIVNVLLAVSLIRDEAGEPQYFVAQIQDITELTAQRQALKDLTSMLAHDLRSATGVVVGFTDLLAMSWPELSDEERDSHLTRIASAGRSIEALLENSLTASTLDSGQLRTEPREVAIAEVVERTLQNLTVEGVEVDLAGAGTARAFVDPVHLQQILTNLITNAHKYGGGRILVSAATSDRALEVSVTDNGPGVEPEFVPHLFDRFARSASARSGPERGTGLGLAIVHDLLDLNGGCIEYTQAPGSGARFTVYLPRADVLADELSQSAPHAR